ncbi:unnamed protein product [Clonostachys solani]|uniref:Major facilitator superfamily (MFS) profile domain-containing protein n=1 Tax=Clonostachys solani TaxID=160281 RepID=A0A9N9W617_9HYPO|nr:unnamed protein product [Clonostachys solani]
MWTRRSVVPILYIFFGGLTFFVYGVDYGYLNGLLAAPLFIKKFGTYDASTDTYAILSSRLSLLSSTIYIGSFFGAFIAAAIGDKIGKKWGLLIGCFTFAAGAAIQLAAVNVNMFIAGRAICGLQLAFALVLSPAYINEIAPKHLRGLGVSMGHQILTFGNFFTALMTYAATRRTDELSYQIPISLCIMAAGVCSLALLFMPETPMHWARRGNWEKSRATIAQMRSVPIDDPVVAEEVFDMQETMRYHNALGESTWAELFHRQNIRRTFYSAANIVLYNAFSGTIFFLSYGAVFIRQAGFTNPIAVTALLAGTNAVGSFPGIWLVERLGRRPMKFIGGTGVAVCNLVCAVVYTVRPTAPETSKTIVAFITLGVFCLAAFYQPAGWAYTAEIPTARLRQKTLGFANACCTLFLWTFQFCSPYIFQDPVYLGAKICYIWLGGICICLVFDYFCLYETKGLSHHEIDMMMDAVITASQSTKWGNELIEARSDLPVVHEGEVCSVEENVGGEEKEKS